MTNKTVEDVKDQIAKEHGSNAIKTGKDLKKPELSFTWIASLNEDQYQRVAKILFYEALSQAQGEMREIARSEDGYNYKYAPIDQVIAVTRPILAKYGLSIMQPPINDGEKVGVKTIVGHKFGYEKETQLTMQITDIVSRGNAAQQIGAAITYLRRYALMAVCGLAPEDDDAQSLNKKANTQTVKKPVKQATKTNSASMITKKQVVAIKTLMDKKGITKEKAQEHVQKNYKVDSMAKLTSAQASTMIKKLHAMEDVEMPPDVTMDDAEEAFLNEVDAGIEAQRG